MAQIWNNEMGKEDIIDEKNIKRVEKVYREQIKEGESWNIWGCKGKKKKGECKEFEKLYV